MLLDNGGSAVLQMPDELMVHDDVLEETTELDGNQFLVKICFRGRAFFCTQIELLNRLIWIMKNLHFQFVYYLEGIII